MAYEDIYVVGLFLTYILFCSLYETVYYLKINIYDNIVLLNSSRSIFAFISFLVDLHIHRAYP